MTHRNAPLTPTGRARLVARHLDDEILKAHVAAEFRVSRTTVTTWVERYLEKGQEGLYDRASVPSSSPAQTAPEVVERIEALRRGQVRRRYHLPAHLAGLCLPRHRHRLLFEGSRRLVHR